MSDSKECPFCGETIKTAAKKCRFCGEWLDGYTRESVVGDKITTGDLSDVKGAAIGRAAQAASTGDVGGSFIQAQGDVTLGNTQRDVQYDIALSWEARGKPRMSGFDLSERDLKWVKLRGVDLRDANLSGADLSGADLLGAKLQGSDLSGTNLSGAKLRVSLPERRMAEARMRRAIYEYETNDSFRRALRQSALRDANLSGANYNAQTLWPAGFDPIAAGAINVDEETL